MWEGIEPRRRKTLRLSTMQILALGFLGVIVLGGVLLWLPISNAGGQNISFIDALFTSTTAVCVTGLVTVVPATQFTLFGKVILLIFIQIGGLGVVACATSFFVILGKKITVRERALIQETYSLERLSGMVSFIIKILKGTAIVEGIGAAFFAIQFIPEFGLVKGIGYGIFHSISAFCNAGIDILGEVSFANYATNPLINFTTMLLIIMSGIGYTVWFDISHNISRVKKREISFKGMFGHFTLHSKLAITVTIILLITGTLGFYLLEYNNGKTLGSLQGGEKFMAAAFQSVTTRTAGFYTVSQNGLTDASKLLSSILMFIGGSPGGTAGGVKTTTVAMLLLTCVTIIRGGADTECFKRRIAAENVRTGFAIFTIALVTMLLGVVSISIIEDAPFLNILMEVTSALGTVGLTADFTPNAKAITKCILMVLMYIGRIGPITMGLAFGFSRNPKEKLRKLPEKRILVG